jgi:hypothetical protein
MGRVLVGEALEGVVMADIQQAAEWMKEGKRVRRISERSLSYVYRMRPTDGFPEMLTFMGEWTEKSILTVDDLLADDWEIAD